MKRKLLKKKTRLDDYESFFVLNDIPFQQVKITTYLVSLLILAFIIHVPMQLRHNMNS